jgi:hypothetical protein
MYAEVLRNLHSCTWPYPHSCLSTLGAGDVILQFLCIDAVSTEVVLHQLGGECG